MRKLHVNPPARTGKLAAEKSHLLFGSRLVAAAADSRRLAFALSQHCAIFLTAHISGPA